MTPLLEWQQIPSQLQSVLFLGQHYQRTTGKWFHDIVHNVWDITINGLRKNDTTAWVATNTFTATKCAIFGTTLWTDYGKIIPRQSVLCLGQHYQQITEKWFRDKVRYVWDDTINGLWINVSATKCAVFGTTLWTVYKKMIHQQSVLCLGQENQLITEKL